MNLLVKLGKNNAIHCCLLMYEKLSGYGHAYIIVVDVISTLLVIA